MKNIIHNIDFELMKLSHVTLDANIFVDSNLSDHEKLIICIAYVIRSEIEKSISQYGMTTIDMVEITTSKISRLFSNGRDHTRRLLNKMSKSEYVKKYVEIKLLKRKDLKEDDRKKYPLNAELPILIFFKKN